MQRGKRRDFLADEARAERWIVRVGRLLTLALLLFFTVSLGAGKRSWVFLDNVNLVLHEAGHFLFRPFGQTTSVLGGTIGQLIWPLAFAIYFWWRRRSLFAGLVCVWWVGENLQNIAVYVSDAIDQGLPLVGGEIHDWNYLLGRWGALRSCLTIGNALRVVGWVIMLGSLSGVGYTILRVRIGASNPPPD